MAVYTWEPYMCDPKLRRRLGSITTPTLVVWGDEDRLVSIDYGRAYADSIPGAEFETVGEAGHYPAEEQPECFLEIVGRFLA
jgi:pimeloyl-ACP methyl ester carboxylesterase